MRIWELWVCVMTVAVTSVMGGESTLESGGDLSWLLVEESPSSQPQQGAQVTVRRITPKSVFVAPTFTSCSEGYRQDPLGRCVKVVKVNPSAQWDFFLKKLNSMYASPPEPKTKPNPGPFRLPIPLATEAPALTTTTTTAPITTSTELTTSSTITEQPSMSTTVLSTTTEEQSTDVPFLIVVANTTEQISTVTDQTSTTPSTTTTEPTTSDTTTICNDCDTTITFSTPASMIQPSRTTIVFPEDSTHKRNSSPLVRFPESSLSQKQQQQQQSPYWWPQSWEPGLWQPPASSAYYQPRQTRYGHREARPAWHH